MKIPTSTELIEAVQKLPAGEPLLERLAARAQAPHATVHLVGGAVRDLLLGGAPTELDLVVEDQPERIARLLGGECRMHERFGTATVTLDGIAYDIGMARTETYSEPGALPDVAPATVQEDLRRRDFTVNAIALALDGDQPGSLSAASGALEDLEHHWLRVLHPASFIDDPTRILRLVRYQARLSFEIEAETGRLARDAVLQGALGTVSRTRIGNELRLLASEDDPVAPIRGLGRFELGPLLAPGFGLRDADVATRALGLLPPDGRRDLLVLAAAALDVPPDDLLGALDELAFIAQDRDVIAHAARRGRPLTAALSTAARPSEIAAAVAGGSPELVALAGALGADPSAREWLERLRHVRLSIDGEDLLAAGIPEGPAIGAGLRAALAARLDGKATTPEQELAEAQRAASESG